MTETFRRTKHYKIDHKKFGGYIYSSDFNTDYRGKDTPNGSTVANRIVQDDKFDKQCGKNKEIFNTYKKGNKTNA